MKDTLTMEVDVIPSGISVEVMAAGKDAYRVLKALGHIQPAHPHQVRTVIITVGPIVEQR